jgi:CRP-like cAMP-binding protein
MAVCSQCGVEDPEQFRFCGGLRECLACTAGGASPDAQDGEGGSSAIWWAAGTVIIGQEGPGDHFHVVAEREVLVSVDDEPVSRLGPGAHFGEIALLRNVPRTATVRAQGQVRLHVLDRGDFLEAVTGNPRSAELAEVVVRDRLT